MSSINSVGGTQGGLPVQKVATNPVAKSDSTTPAQHTPVKDRVELSGVSHLLKSLQTGGDVRAHKIADIRAQIEAGTYYDDDHKLDAAADRLLDDLSK